MPPRFDNDPRNPRPQGGDRGHGHGAGPLSAGRSAKPGRLKGRLRALLMLTSVFAAAVGIGYAAYSTVSGSKSADLSEEPSAASHDRGSRNAKRTSPSSAPAPVPDGRARADWVSHKGPVPILMYHVINYPIPNAPYPDLYVNPSNFRAQMKWLKENGYVAVTLDEVWKAWKDGGKLPPKPVVLSFDDGPRSVYTNASPVLRKLGWPGVLNLELKVLEHPDWGLTADMVKKLIAAGWEVDSHTINHVDVSVVSGAELLREVAESRKIIQGKFGVPVNFFCYPSGKYDDEAIAAVKAAGYRGATTVEPGAADSTTPFTMKRIRINGSMGISAFAASVESAT